MPTDHAVRLAQAGPVDPDHGFPMWFEDGGVPPAGGQPGRAPARLELVLDADPRAPVVGELPQPGKPLAFPDNFPDEAFYFAAEAELPVGGAGVVGRARVLLHLEAAFGGDGTPKAGMQVVFARIRVRMDDVIPNGTYVVTHPYGVTDTLTADDRGRVFHTQDLGIVEGDPTAVVGSGRVAPFLRTDTDPATGYVAAGNVEQAVVGSPLGTPYVMIQGPRIREGGGGADPQAPADMDRVWTDRFTVQGRVARRLGAWVERATYERGVQGPPTLMVVARAPLAPDGEAPDLRVIGPGVHFRLRGSGPWQMATGPAAAVPPAGTAWLVNVTDDPPSRFALHFEPAVVIAAAAYDADARTLAIDARCSDPDAELDLPQLGLTLVPGAQTLADVAVPPALLQVRARIGGSEVTRREHPVAFSGGAAQALDAEVRVIVHPAAPQVGDTVTLDGRTSAGATAHAWARIAGPSVTLTDADQPKATFVATDVGTYRFRLTVQGQGSPAPQTVEVVVERPQDGDIDIARAAYRTRRRQYDIGGTVERPPNLMTITIDGVELGTAAADGLGNWRLRRTLGSAETALVAEPGAMVTVTGRGGAVAKRTVLVRD